MLHVDDPGGTHLEIYAGPALAHRPPASSGGIRFVAGDLGLGHVVLPEQEMDAAMEFYEQVLGFQHRDSMRLPGGVIPGRDPEKGDAWIRFLGCNARHHSVALFEGPAASGIVHFMVEVDDLDAVGRSLDRCRDARLADLRVARTTHERSHGVVLRGNAGWFRHRVRDRRSSGQPRYVGGDGDHRGELLGSPLGERRMMARPIRHPAALRDRSPPGRVEQTTKQGSARAACQRFYRGGSG